MTTGVMAGLSCLVVVIIGGFITATAVKEGLNHVPVESPIPGEAPQLQSLPL